jgi:hypothetical protein
VIRLIGCQDNPASVVDGSCFSLNRHCSISAAPISLHLNLILGDLVVHARAVGDLRRSLLVFVSFNRLVLSSFLLTSSLPIFHCSIHSFSCAHSAPSPPRVGGGCHCCDLAIATMGKSPPFLYGPPDAFSFRGPTDPPFNPKAVTQASWTRPPPKKKQKGPLINFNRHPDSVFRTNH